MVGEKKHQALAPLQSNAPDLAATFILIETGATQARVLAAEAFARQHQLPIVLKPDVGQRGRGGSSPAAGTISPVTSAPSKAP